jgi:signal transduction histidine kinase
MSNNSKPQVLIVEDDSIIANRIMDILAGEGYETIIVDSGEEAVQYIREYKDLVLILMDIRLKGALDGVDAAEKIREVCDIPLIYLTAYSDENLIQRAKRTNSFGYLIKPIRGRELMAAIEMALYKYKLDQQQKQLNEHIYAIRKRESLGLMASALAHHFNNLTMIIQGNAELIAEDVSKESPVGMLIQNILKTTTRTSALTKQILKYTGMYVSESKPIDIDISKLINEMEPMIKISVPKRIEVNFNLKPDIKPIIIDSFDIRQLIVELVANAIAAITKSGFISISTGEILDYSVPPDEFLQNSEPKDYIFLEVKDDGCGMDISTKKAMFDPFFTTKSFGRGIGLAAVSGIVQKSCGSIVVNSLPGEGTCVKVLFPTYC